MRRLSRSAPILRRWLFRALFWVLFNALVLGTIDYAFFRSYLRRRRPARWLDLPQISRDTGLPRDLIHSVGNFTVAPGRRDLRALPLAHPGQRRIGAFGDSFTFGTEVPDALSYPSRLQRLLRDSRDTTEVVNFGTGWYGFS